MLEAKGQDEELAVLILDFRDAFMSIPLHTDERPFNCTILDDPITVGRPTFDGEPTQGRCIVWQVLGFGGKPNPLVYSRAASFAMRTGQALFRQSPVKTRTLLKGQLYVDDPAIVAKGKREDVVKELDLLLAWWMALGIPLAWAKGKLVWNQAPHEWIGVRYTPTLEGNVLMELPPKFLEEFLVQLEPFCRTKGGCSLKDAERVVGRAGRVAHIVPAARPFTTGLYAALSAEKAAIRGGRSRTHGRLVAAKRFASAACWLRQLVRGEEDSVMPLRRLVRATGPLVARTSSWVVQFDASTTGGGAILRRKGAILEYVFLQWRDRDVKALGVTVGDSKCQSFWEFLMVLIALIVWGDRFVEEEVAVIGDSTSALQDALQLKGPRSEEGCGFNSNTFSFPPPFFQITPGVSSRKIRKIVRPKCDGCRRPRDRLATTKERLGIPRGPHPRGEEHGSRCPLQAVRQPCGGLPGGCSEGRQRARGTRCG